MSTEASDAREPLVVRGLTDVRSVREVLWPAFQQSDPDAHGLDYGQEVDMPRLRREVTARAPEDRPDALFVADPILFDRAGIVAPVEGLVPGPRPSAWVDQAGRWISTYAQPIVAIYNSVYRRPPGSWQELADQTWRDRLVMEAPERMLTSGPAFAELHSVLGADRWAAWLSALAANGVRQVADNERAVLEVATGARWVGLANLNVARRVRPGSPVRHVFFDPTPCIPAFAVAVAGGRSPALGRRFVRWLGSSAGQAAYARTGRIPAIEIEGSAAASSSVIPTSVARSAGTADWISDPERWIRLFAAIFPTENVLRAGKLRG
ncbi:MAG: ABC transporter substrate-binding protein [Candidatus Limnocylindrales bacterium]